MDLDLEIKTELNITVFPDKGYSPGRHNSETNPSGFAIKLFMSCPHESNEMERVINSLMDRCTNSMLIEHFYYMTSAGKYK
jgi:hypothetical protein